MTKNNKGAEPKNKRVKHYFTRSEVMHIAVSRDEWCMFKSKCYPVIASNGYIFSDIFDINGIDNIEDYYSLHKDKCIAVIDRKRKIAIIKNYNYYYYNIIKALPDNFVIYKVYNIPCFNPTYYKNKTKLYDEVIKRYINKYLNNIYNQLCCVYNTKYNKYIFDFNIRNAKDIREKLIRFIENHKGININKKLFNRKYCTIINHDINYPTAKEIIEDKIFNDEQKLLLNKCLFYSKYIYNKDTIYNWDDVNTKFDTIINDKKWQDVVAFNIEYRDKILHETFQKAKNDVLQNIKNLEKEHQYDEETSLSIWRNEIKDKPLINYIVIKNCRLKNHQIEWYNEKRCISLIKNFDNIKLRLNQYNQVVTSKYAKVKLKEAIKLFNILNLKYFNNKELLYLDFTKKNIYLENYQLRHIKYTDKKTDTEKPLGYKEWLIQIGCHRLWLDDIKEFVKHYHLEDKVNFPVDKTSQECRENNIIHLINNK